MRVAELLKSKEMKAKEKAARLADALLNDEVTVAELLEAAASAKESEIANCMEACEYVTARKPELGGADMLQFAVRHLGAKAPRFRWESGKVIGNIAHRHPGGLAEAVEGLLENAGHDGTVVRWSAAFALTRILGIPIYAANENFRGRLAYLRDTEEKNSIKNMYGKVLK